MRRVLDGSLSFILSHAREGREDGTRLGACLGGVRSFPPLLLVCMPLQMHLDECWCKDGAGRRRAETGTSEHCLCVSLTTRNARDATVEIFQRTRERTMACSLHCRCAAVRPFNLLLSVSRLSDVHWGLRWPCGQCNVREKLGLARPFSLVKVARPQVLVLAARPAL